MKCFNFAWLMLGLLFLCSGLAAQEFTGKAAEEIIPGAAMVLLEEGNDLPKMIRFRDDARIPVADFAAWEKANMGFGPNIHFGDEISKKDEYGQDHVQRRQFVRNIPVDKSRCVLHIRNGKVYAIN